jgi:DNA invertase Pin-like site-specific DNA recombinase
MQIDALKKAGCHQVFTDVASGAKADRPGLDKALEYLREGDTLVVWKIDRLGRSLVHLVQTIDALRERGVGFRSLTDAGIDTTTRNGKLLFNLFATLAEFERDLISERTKGKFGSGQGQRPKRWPKGHGHAGKAGQGAQTDGQERADGQGSRRSSRRRPLNALSSLERRVRHPYGRRRIGRPGGSRSLAC